MNGKNLVILIADDDADEHGLMQRAISDLNKKVEVYSVFNGLQLIEFLFNKGLYANIKNPIPDIIITDINMPMLDGFDVMKSIKGTPALKDIMVYALTNSSSDDDQLKAKLSGANGFYTKPDRFDDLRNIMKEILSNGKT